jgi:hypothetical protein
MRYDANAKTCNQPESGLPQAISSSQISALVIYGPFSLCQYVNANPTMPCSSRCAMLIPLCHAHPAMPCSSHYATLIPLCHAHPTMPCSSRYAMLIPLCYALILDGLMARWIHRIEQWTILRSTVGVSLQRSLQEFSPVGPN